MKTSGSRPNHCRSDRDGCLGGSPRSPPKGAFPPSETPVRSPTNDGCLGGSPRPPPKGALPPSETPVKSPPNDGFLRGSRDPAKSRLVGTSTGSWQALSNPRYENLFSPERLTDIIVKRLWQYNRESALRPAREGGGLSGRDRVVAGFTRWAASSTLEADRTRRHPAEVGCYAQRSRPKKGIQEGKEEGPEGSAYHHLTDSCRDRRRGYQEKAKAAEGSRRVLAAADAEVCGRLGTGFKGSAARPPRSTPVVRS